MPKKYDFSVSNVDWRQYEKDFLLRTDAVWEKTKLRDVFYTQYKNMIYDKVMNRYMIANIRMMPLPTNNIEQLEDFKHFLGHGDVDGCIWQFRVGPKMQAPATFSHFLADKEGDSWYLCFMTFQKFMMCNEKSPIKLDEANLGNKGFWDYPCYEEVESLFEYCGSDLFEPMFEVYKIRLMSGTQKAQNFSRIQQYADPYNTHKDRKVLHY
jgi:hypothetical protein